MLMKISYGKLENNLFLPSDLNMNNLKDSSRSEFKWDKLFSCEFVTLFDLL